MTPSDRILERAKNLVTNAKQNGTLEKAYFLKKKGKSKNKIESSYKKMTLF